MPKSAPLHIDIWSDIVCPFCFIGRQHLNLALETFRKDHPEREITLHWRSFELDPQAPTNDTRSMAEILSQKYGRTPDETLAMMDNTQNMAKASGLDMNLKTVKRINTHHLHRLLHLAREQNRQDALKAALMHAYFVDNLDLSDTEHCVKIAQKVGLDPEGVKTVLNTDQYTEDVRADQSLGREYGIQGVPFFVFNEKLGVSGAQPVSVLIQALEQA